MNSHRSRKNSQLFSHGRLRSVLIALGAFCAFCVLLSPPAFAQGQGGTVLGVVRDSSGAVVPGASVTITNAATGVTTTTKTDTEGLYSFPYIQPGVYDVSATSSGFQTMKKPGVSVHVTDRVEINFDLKIGTTTEAVTVTGSAPLLQTVDAVTGQTINRTFTNDLPLVNRSALDLAFLAPGIVQPPNSTYGTTTGANNFNSNGSRDQTSDLTIDGVTAGQMAAQGMWLQVAYTPSVDDVQEFKVQQTNFSAEYGFTGATVTNLITRSGTNSWHGSAYDFLRNNALDSQDFFLNQQPSPANALPHLERNVFGGTVGGPIIKNKMFFFFDYEGTRQKELSQANAGVPSAAEKTGNFNELCGQNGGTFDATGLCSAASGQLWDPYTGVYVPGTGTPRTAFIPYDDLATYQSPGTNLAGTGKVLPAQPGNLLDPSMLKMFQFYPDPNRNVGTANYNPFWNWVYAGSNAYNNDQWDLKIDENFNDRNRLNARYSQQSSNTVPMDCFHNNADPCAAFGGPHTGHLFSLQFVRTFGPTTVLDFSYGLTRTADTIFPGNPGDPVPALGMPAYTDTSGYKSFPTIINYGSDLTASSDNNTSIGSAPWSYLRQGQETHDFLASLTHIRGRHELKFGGEFRMHRFNAGQPGTPNGLFSFGPAGTSQTGNWDGTGGDTLADMLIGSGGNWGQYEIPAFLATQNFAWAGYGQDAFHASKKLTVNVGLRYDLTMPQTERWNRLSWLDLTAPSPLQIPGYNLEGGLKFAGSNERTSMDTYTRALEPRIGLAYSLDDKTVIRSGYGIYYAISAAAANANAISPNAPGFFAPTPWQDTYPSNPATPWGTLSNPFPGPNASSSGTGGIAPITGSSLGLLTQLGTANVIGYERTLNQVPYEQSWSFGVQRQLAGNMLLEADYIGKKGTHMYLGRSGDFNLDHLGPEEEQHIGDAAWGAAMGTLVPNPFYGAGAAQGVPQTGLLLATQTTAYQLALPYPQFTAIAVNGAPWSNSSYQALQLRLEKRFSNGLQLLATYVWSKTIDESSDSGNGAPNIGTIDPNNFKLDRAISQYNIPSVFQFTYTYQLPFGRGKHFGADMNPVLDVILGGWQTNGIWRFDDGQPLQVSLPSGSSIPLPGYGQVPDLVGTPKRNPKSQWLNPGGYFVDPTVFKVPAHYTIGTAPRTLPSINAPGTANANLSLFKEFPLSKVREGAHLEFRTEWFNAFNHPQFGAPNTALGNASFGQVLNQANSPRVIQMALKFYF